MIGAGEPALPGVALGHNEQIGFGFTIVGIDQEDIYVEKLNPANPNQYLSKGAWKAVEIERQKIQVKGMTPLDAELRFTQHGPILYEDRGRFYAALGQSDSADRDRARVRRHSEDRDRVLPPLTSPTNSRFPA